MKKGYKFTAYDYFVRNWVLRLILMQITITLIGVPIRVQSTR